MRLLRYTLLGLLCGLAVLAAQSFVLAPFHSPSGACSIPLLKIYPNPDTRYDMPMPEPRWESYAIKEVDPPAPACDEPVSNRMMAEIERTMSEPPLNQSSQFLIPKLGPLQALPQK